MEITNLASDKFISVERFEFESSMGGHDHCEVLAVIREGDADNFSGLLDRECTVKDKALDWTGVISESEIIRRVAGVYVRVRLEGLTVRHDKIIRNRIFQQPEKTFEDIFKAMALNGAMLDGAAKKISVPGIQLQDGETDYAFLKRLAASLGLNLFAQSRGALKFVAGEFLSDAQRELDIGRVKIWRRTESAGGNRLELSTEENLNVGEKIGLEGKTFIVTRKRLVMESSRVVEYCRLIEYGKHESESSTSEKILPAKVVENNDPDKRGRVRVEFVDPFEDALSKTRDWIAMGNDHSSGDRGLVFVPNIGDAVLVCVRDGSGIYFSARREEKISAPFDDPAKKYIIIGKEKYIELNDEALLIRNKNATVEVGEEKISLMVGDNAIKIDKSELVLNVSGTTVKLSGGGVDIN